MQKDQAIKEYLQAEYVLFPVNGKIPAVKEWQKTRLNPFRPVESFPNNFGVCLQADDLVLDIDVGRNKDGTEKQGKASFAQLGKDIGYSFKATLAVKTGSGGFHFYFKKPPELKIREKWRKYPDIEFKSVGRYVVGAGSIHPETKKLYKIVQGVLNGVQKAPAKLLEIIKHIPKGFTDKPGLKKYLDDAQSISRCKAYLERVEGAVEGSGGDSDTYVIACRCRSFGLSPQTALSLMLAVWNKKCKPPWDVQELQLKVSNAYQYDDAPLGHKAPEADFEGVPVAKKYLWTGKIDKKTGTRPPSLKNTVNYIDIEESTKDLLKYNMFTDDIEFTRKPIWYPADKNLVPWADGDAVQLKFLLSTKQRYDAPTMLYHEGAYIDACTKPYHPLRDYLNALVWDGKPRLDTWLTHYAGVKNNAYSRTIGSKTLLAAVARVFKPGYKFDNVLVIEGKQRIGKSRLIDALGKEWYGDMRIDPHHKDTIAVMRDKWIIELAEMEAVRKAEVNALKAFLSRRVDRVRLSHRKNAEDFPRQCIFIGTVNPDEGGGYLRDTTGNSRFWPVLVEGKIHVDKMQRDVDQLWAETVAKYKSENFSLHIEDPAIREFAEIEAEKRRSRDPWLNVIKDWLNTPTMEHGVRKHAKGLEIFIDALDGIKTRYNRPEMARIAQIMKELGWRKGVYRCTISHATVNGYIRPKDIDLL